MNIPRVNSGAHWYYAPDHVKALRDPVTGKYDTMSCEFMRAVILEDRQ